MDDELTINGRRYIAVDALHRLKDLHVFGLDIDSIARLRRFFQQETGKSPFPAAIKERVK